MVCSPEVFKGFMVYLYYNIYFDRMGKHTVGDMVKKQIEASGFNTKEMKISGTSLRSMQFE